MTYYSIDGAYPVTELPKRHRLSSGLTRTSLHEMTSQELAALDPPITVVPDPGDPLPATQKHSWDGATLSIVAKTQEEQDSYTANRKAERRAEVMALLAQKIVAGFSYAVPGGSAHNYQIDDTSQANMVAVMADFNAGTTNAHGGFWRASDNTNETMSDAECKAFLIAAKAYKMGLIRQSFVHKAGLDAQSTAAEVDAYDITADW